MLSVNSPSFKIRVTNSTRHLTALPPPTLPPFSHCPVNPQNPPQDTLYNPNPTYHTTQTSTSTPPPPRQPTMDNDTPTPSPYLQSFISKTLRITTTDTRVFVGELKCTDKVRPAPLRPPPRPPQANIQCQAKNLILSQTHEYRYPSAHEIAAAAAAGEEERLRMQLKSRYIGLVVVPGEYIVKVEVEDGGLGGL